MRICLFFEMGVPGYFIIRYLLCLFWGCVYSWGYAYLWVIDYEVHQSHMMVIESYDPELLRCITNPYGKILKDFVNNHDLQHYISVSEYLERVLGFDIFHVWLANVSHNTVV